MSHIEDIKRTMDEMLRAFHDIVLDGGEGAASRELEKLRERMPVSVELDPESTAEKDQRTKDVVELAMRTSQIEGHVRTLFERYNESQVVPDEFEDIFLARIDHEDSGGGGEYDQWAEVESDTETGGLKTKAGGRTHTSSGESLWEANGVTGVPTGEYVLVSIEPGDNILYTFEYPHDSEGKAINQGSAPMQLDKWYDIQADKVWGDIDTRDWSGRFLEVACQYKPDSGNVAGIQWVETDVQHYNIDTAAWVAQATNEWFRIWLKDGGAAQNITKIDQAGDTDFHLRMNTDGALQIKVENHNANMQVRFWLRAGRKILNTKAEAIT